MTKKELQNTITNTLVPKPLAKAISDGNVEYSELELCAMVYRYSVTYD